MSDKKVESKTDKFIRLANSRGDKLLNQITSLGKLGTSYAYEVDADEAREMLEKFEKALDELKTKWENGIQRSRVRANRRANSDNEVTDDTNEALSTDSEKDSTEVVEEEISETSEPGVTESSDPEEVDESQAVLSQA